MEAEKAPDDGVHFFAPGVGLAERLRRRVQEFIGQALRQLFEHRFGRLAARQSLQGVLDLVPAAALGAVAQGTGTLATPLGAKLLRTSAMPAGKIIGLDKNYALERICGSEVLVEYDKLIDRQLERAAITSISGFAKPYQEASKVLSLQ